MLVQLKKVDTAVWGHKKVFDATSGKRNERNKHKDINVKSQWGAQMVIYQNWVTVWADGWLIGVVLLFVAMDNLVKSLIRNTENWRESAEITKKKKLDHSRLYLYAMPIKPDKFFKLVLVLKVVCRCQRSAFILRSLGGRLSSGRLPTKEIWTGAGVGAAMVLMAVGNLCFSSSLSSASPSKDNSWTCSSGCPCLTTGMELDLSLWILSGRSPVLEAFPPGKADPVFSPLQRCSSLLELMRWSLLGSLETWSSTWSALSADRSLSLRPTRLLFFSRGEGGVGATGRGLGDVREDFSSCSLTL